MLGTIGGVGEGLVAAVELAAVGTFTSVCPHVDLQVFQSREGLGTPWELLVWVEGQEGGVEGEGGLGGVGEGEGGVERGEGGGRGRGRGEGGGGGRGRGRGGGEGEGGGRRRGRGEGGGRGRGRGEGGGRGKGVGSGGEGEGRRRKGEMGGWDTQ